MKEDNIATIMKLWETEIQKRAPEVTPYDAKDQVGKMAALFTPGLFFFYIFNFSSMKMEYVHPGVKTIVGIDPEECTMEGLLTNFNHPDEAELISKKEKAIMDFFYNYLEPEQINDYKLMYLYRAIDKHGRNRLMLHQSMNLEVKGKDYVQHVLGIHTDITYLNIIKNDCVSFIHLRGGESYYNFNPDDIPFAPEKCDQKESEIFRLLTTKEKKIVRFLARGLGSDEIADKLNISPNTVATHKKNILRKTGSPNTTELVARSVLEGII